MSFRPRIRQHVNPLLAKFEGIHPKGVPLYQDIGHPLEVELGCADAHFLFERARLYPAHQYVGVEIRKEWVDAVNARAQEEHALNVQAVFANLNHDLASLFAPAQIDKVFINFPDPWFKRAHHKRRLVRPGWVQALTHHLRVQGELFFQSDVFELALEAMEVFEQTPGLVNVCGEWSFCRDNPYLVRSLRELRVLSQEQPVWRILYRRVE